MELLEGEKIILKTKAQKSLLYYRLFNELISGLVLAVIFLTVISFALAS